MIAKKSHTFKKVYYLNMSFVRIPLLEKLPKDIRLHEIYRFCYNPSIEKYVRSYGHILEMILSHPKYSVKDVLKAACKYGYLDLVKYCIENGAAPGIRSPSCTLLQTAIKGGHFEVIKYLISVGCNVRINDDECIQLAAKNGYFDIVRSLVHAGASVNAGKRFPVIYAVITAGCLETLQCIAFAGGSVHDNNEYPLYIACEKGYFDCVKYLVQECKADFHAKKGRAWRGAALNGHMEIVQYFVSLGASSPVVICDAVKGGHIDIVKYLISTFNAQYQRCVDMAFVEACGQGQLDIVKYLAPLRSCEYERYCQATAAERAASRNQRIILQHLIDTNEIQLIALDELFITAATYNATDTMLYIYTFVLDLQTQGKFKSTLSSSYFESVLSREYKPFQ